MRTKGTTKSNVGEPSKPRTGHVGFEPTYAGIKIPCLTAWRMPYIYCHMKAMASIWPNIIAMLVSLEVVSVSLFNVAPAIANEINVSHTVVAIFNTNMIYTSFSSNVESIMHVRVKNTIEAIIETRSGKNIA